MKVYICGPMTGYPNLNYPAFNEAAAHLRSEGFEVINPAENEDGTNRNWHQFMTISLGQICTVERLFLLDGWEKSKGARLEVIVAAMLHCDFELENGLRKEARPILTKALVHALFANEGGVL